MLFQDYCVACAWKSSLLRSVGVQIPATRDNLGPLAPKAELVEAFRIHYNDIPPASFESGCARSSETMME